MIPNLPLNRAVGCQVHGLRDRLSGQECKEQQANQRTRFKSATSEGLSVIAAPIQVFGMFGDSVRSEAFLMALAMQRARGRDNNDKTIR